MEKIKTDILISGGGIAGLTAACAFGSAGFQVLCVDPIPPIIEEGADGADLRTTAFLQPARQLFERAGLWEQLAPFAAELKTMRIVDAGGATCEARDVSDFVAAEISELPFGWNFPNWLLRREILKQIDRLECVTFMPGVATRQLTTRQSAAITTLSNAQIVSSDLVIAADGRNSEIRKMLRIGAKTWRYGQRALVFAVTHEIPHDNVSTEIHRTGGPFTLVPLPDQDGAPRSAVVWMDKSANIEKLQKMPISAFEDAIRSRSAHLFGIMKLVSKRNSWPIISQHANQLIAQRTALIAEAAHVVPPIGAQGLNMSLADTTALLDLAIAAPSALGSAQMLKAYQTERLSDVKTRVRGIDLLNRISMAQNPMLRDLRRYGLKTIHGVKPLRKTVMNAGLGATYNT